MEEVVAVMEEVVAVMEAAVMVIIIHHIMDINQKNMFVCIIYIKKKKN